MKEEKAKSSLWGNTATSVALAFTTQKIIVVTDYVAKKILCIYTS